MMWIVMALLLQGTALAPGQDQDLRDLALNSPITNVRDLAQSLRVEQQELQDMSFNLQGERATLLHLQQALANITEETNAIAKDWQGKPQPLIDDWMCCYPGGPGILINN